MALSRKETTELTELVNKVEGLNRNRKPGPTPETELTVFVRGRGRGVGQVDGVGVELVINLGRPHLRRTGIKSLLMIIENRIQIL